MNGRGAWSNAGVGGTLQQRGDDIVPGPYYMKAAPGEPLVGSWGTGVDDVNYRATAYAVISIQRRLRVVTNLPLRTSGSFDADTEDAVATFQRRRKEAGLTVWGGVGMDTCRELFRNRLRRVVGPEHDEVVCGLVTNESAFDPGAVGYVDPSDLGLAQINGPSHPTYTEAERFNPTLAFEFVDDYLRRALDALNDNMTDAIVSYNLGVGGYSQTHDRMVGARGWIADGRPDRWTPPGQTTERDIRGYYTRIQTACATPPEVKAVAANARDKTVRLGVEFPHK